MRIIEGFDKARKLLDRQAPKDLEYKQEATVRQIISDVRQHGDKALFELTEKFDGANYLDYISEHVEPWSYLKFPYYKKLGFPDGVYRVGPLGRLNIAEKIDTPLANAELKLFKALNLTSVEKTTEAEVFTIPR